MISLIRLIHRLPRTLSDRAGRLAHAELRLDALDRPTVAPAPQPTPESEKVGGDCWTCGNSSGMACSVVNSRMDVARWLCAHTEDDAATRLPDSPPCPAWRAR